MDYCGIDLGARKTQVCIINQEGEVVRNTKVSSDIGSVLNVLENHGGSPRVVAESTFNWDWLVDGLQDHGYDIRLAHTLDLHAISHAKVKTDRRDSKTLATLLRGDLIPEVNICPQDMRGLRDLLRRRWRLVADRGKEYRAIRHLLYRQGRWDHTLNEVKGLDTEDASWVSDHPELQIIARHNLERVDLLSRQIDELEERLTEQVDTVAGDDYQNLMTIPGIGTTIAMTIILETHSISRFPDSRHYSSYCRVVPGCANSCDTKKRGRNSKQGNAYLKWAYMHAAGKAVQFYDDFKRLHAKHLKRHSGKGGKMVAYNTVAHRLVQVAFHVLRDKQPYQAEKLFPKKTT